ncbi:hypothetical protein DRE_01282 [Drechslerella stenobrocha 248]|uniref:Uncharacterized protein n=1 Tax=Drechslerella stenobrocha 248 TaxID=1043628 RepID=W7I596_9PEZI|nr:hypothetical protein DRE_01282 [Drechslerella stenobrocha 248]
MQCTSPYLLLSTNDGVDWNPLSDAFNSLSISGGAYSEDTLQVPAPSAPAVAATQQVMPVEFVEPPTIQDEMKRRSLILSELMSFREALHNQQQLDAGEDTTDQVGGNGYSGGGHDDGHDEMSNMQRTFRELLDLRRQSGMFLLDEVEMDHGVDMHAHAGQYVDQTDLGMHMGYMHDAYTSGDYQPLHQQEEGMFDDPPVEYVNAHPPVRSDGVYMHLSESRSLQNGIAPVASQAAGMGSGNESYDNDDDDDDEGQVYATPEQREQMRTRRRELRMDKEAREREMLWRKYTVGGLGIGGNG